MLTNITLVAMVRATVFLLFGSKTNLSIFQIDYLWSNLMTSSDSSLACCKLFLNSSY
ncbi:unnamed protein product [Ixodes pacificus]